MAENVYHGNKLTSTHIGADKSDEDIEKAKSADKLTDTTRLGAKKEDIPKPGPGEDMMSPAYRERLRAFREKQKATPKAMGQRAALSGK